MKKIYLQPQTDVCETLPAQMLAASGVSGTGAAEIGWGGTDTDPNAGGNAKGDWGDIWE